MENILSSTVSLYSPVIQHDVQYSVDFVKCEDVVCCHFLVFNSIGSCLALSWASMKSLVNPLMSKSCYRVGSWFLMTGDLLFSDTRMQSFTFSQVRKRLEPKYHTWKAWKNSLAIIKSICYYLFTLLYVVYVILCVVLCLVYVFYCPLGEDKWTKTNFHWGGISPSNNC